MLAVYYYAVSEISFAFLVLYTALFAILANVKITINKEEYKQYSYMGTIFVSAIIVFLMSQFMLNAGIKNLNAGGWLLSISICFLWLFIFSFVCGKLFPGIVIGSVLLMIFASADYTVYLFRGNELTPLDILSIKTALSVSEGYIFRANACFVLAWLGIAAYLIFISDCDLRIDRRNDIKKHLITIVSGVLVIITLSSNMNSVQWSLDGAMYRGFFSNFFIELRENKMKKPANYNLSELRKLLSAYNNEVTVNTDVLPNIIVIMNESFADLQRLETHFETSEEVMPYIKSLDDNVIKGYAYASVFGGTTANSEFEFLTGFSTAFLPPSTSPYKQYVDKDTVSMTYYLKKLGYRCEAFHPFFSSGWSRDRVYPLFGFDETFFIDAFEQNDLIRGFVSDKYMYKTMIKRYKARDKKKPYFMFGVTIQNHGGYTDEDYDSFIKIKRHEGEYPDAEQYLSLINQSDDAFKYLIKSFKKREEPVVIVLFGDHLPALSDEFYEFARGGTADDDDLDYKMKEYEVPFVIWANYDIKSRDIDKTSLNYLSNYVYDAAGIQIPFNSVLKDIEEEIPALNAQGYYSTSDKGFKPVDKAEDIEKEALETYRNLQYNIIFDRKNRIDIFSKN